jgi:putative intracellular protease/amidase
MRTDMAQCMIMIRPNMNGRQIRHQAIGMCIFITLTMCIGTCIPLFANADTHTTNPIKILFVMDNDFGMNYYFIRDIFDRYGWDITTTALNQTIIGCSYEGGNPLDVDITISEIDDVTEYDVLTIMPGSSHESLRVNTTALDLIRDAVEQNLTVSAWCRAVRVLAAADVIDGKNVTGHADYQSEYEAAGATFIYYSPPVTDGNIITSVRSRFYREEICIAIATAVDYYEPNPPTFGSITVNPSPSVVNCNTTITVSIGDETQVHMVYCDIFELNETGGREDSYSYHREMTATETDGEFEITTQDLDIGNYTVDILAWDCFLSYAEFFDAAGFIVVEETTTATTTTTTTAITTTTSANTTTTTQEGNLMQWIILGTMIGGAVVFVGVFAVIQKKR